MTCCTRARPAPNEVDGGTKETEHLEEALHKDVAEFEVTVDDLVGVHIVTSTDELYHEETGLGLGEPSSAAEHVHERAVVAELEGHVDVIGVLEAFLELDDVGMGEGLVDFDLGVKLGWK